MSERDIVERLENEAKVFEQTLLNETVDLLREAAAEIARLRETRDLLCRARDALLESQLWGVNCKPSPPEANG